MDKFVKLGQDMVLLWSKYKVMYWAGIWNTLKLAFLATLIGCFIGLLCGVLNTIPYTKKDPLPKRFLLKLLRVVIRIYVEVFRGTPMVLQAVFIFYGLPMIGFTIPDVSWIPNFSRFTAGIVAMSMNSCAYVAEIIRSGIQAVDGGQMEAARSVGFSSGEAMRLVVLPQAVRNILPALGNEFVTVIKESSIVSVIGIADLMFRTNDVIAVTYKNLECLAIAALCYFAMTFTGGRLIALAERKMNHGK